jgi:hypothetical protein
MEVNQRGSELAAGRPASPNDRQPPRMRPGGIRLAVPGQLVADFRCSAKGRRPSVVSWLPSGD